jgi:hypothetical protein
MKIARSLLAAALLSGSVLALVACSDDPPKTHVTPAECEPIAELCHPSVTTEGQECHESAEGTWTAAECTANLADCTAKCTPDAGPPGTPDAAVADASAEDAETP